MGKYYPSILVKYYLKHFCCIEDQYSEKIVKQIECVDRLVLGHEAYRYDPTILGFLCGCSDSRAPVRTYVRTYVRLALQRS